MLQIVMVGLGMTLAAQELKREAPRPLAPNAASVGQLAPDLADKTVDGKPFRLSAAMKGKTAYVVALTSTTCPLSKKYLPTLTKLETEFGEKVGFIYLDPVATDTPAETAGFPKNTVHDRDGTLAKALGARTTTDVFVLDARRTVVYHGAVDDQYGLGYSTDEPKKSYLKDALAAVLAGKDVPVPATTAPGCALDLAAAKEMPAPAATYHNRISRIVQANCQACHREGGVGPFKLDTLADLVAHKGMVKKVLAAGTMPPWSAVHPTGPDSPFVNDRTVPEADKAAVAAWFDAGAPAGDETDAPLPRAFPKEWAIGVPDLVVELPKAIAVKATGTMPYQHVVVETDLDEDKWVDAVEVQPTDRAVVHHVLVFVLPPLKKGEIESPRRAESQGYFAAYVPGNNSAILPDGLGRKFPKGARVIFQIHYTPNGTATTDRTRVGFRFAKEALKHEMRVLALANPKFSIPPGADNHKDTAQLKLPVDAVILAYSPHMHVRGKACKFERDTAAGKTETLLDVPHYDFNWQLQYKLAEPLRVSRGETVRFTAWYDNSTANPFNPDPKATVKWGPQTSDEMLIGYIEYYFPNGTPLGFK